jgi:hypothetical protein
VIRIVIRRILKVWWFNLQVFNFMLVQKQYAFSRNCRFIARAKRLESFKRQSTLRSHLVFPGSFNYQRKNSETRQSKELGGTWITGQKCTLKEWVWAFQETVTLWRFRIAHFMGKLLEGRIIHELRHWERRQVENSRNGWEFSQNRAYSPFLSLGGILWCVMVSDVWQQILWG